MWIPIEDCPDGCVIIEVLWLRYNCVKNTCSCDVHWDKSQGNPIPDFFRGVADLDVSMTLEDFTNDF